jgi:hypothetical protein
MSKYLGLYPISVHLGSRKDAGLLNRFSTVGGAKTSARSESKKLGKAGGLVTVFDENGFALALYDNGKLVQSWKPAS